MGEIMNTSAVFLGSSCITWDDVGGQKNLMGTFQDGYHDPVVDGHLHVYFVNEPLVRFHSSLSFD